MNAIQPPVPPHRASASGMADDLAPPLPDEAFDDSGEIEPPPLPEEAFDDAGDAAPPPLPAEASDAPAAPEPPPEPEEEGSVLRPADFGWPGSEAPAMSPFALETVDAPVRHGRERFGVPEYVVVGRDFQKAKTPYLELRFATPEQRRRCSRTYVILTHEGGNDYVNVMLAAENTSQFAVVNGRRISRKGELAPLAEGGILELNPGFKFRLVRREEP